MPRNTLSPYSTISLRAAGKDGSRPAGPGGGMAVTRIRWAFRIVRDALLAGWANGSWGLSLATLLLLVPGLLIPGVELAAPIIYPLF